MWNTVAKEGMKWLKGIAAAELSVLVAEIRADPEKFANNLITYVGPVVTAVTESEIRLRREVYKSFAAILAQAFSIPSEDTYQWVLAQVEDADLPPEIKAQGQVQVAARRIPSPLVMRVQYRRLGSGEGYERVCEAVWKESDEKARKANFQERVTWDQIPSDVQSEFLQCNSPDLAYQLFPQVNR